MLLLKSAGTLSNPSLPTYNPSAAELALADITGLNLWLESGDSYTVRDGSGRISAWVDRTIGRRFVPVGASPLSVAIGSGKAVRMGFGSGLSGTDNGALRAEDDADILGSSGYTIAALVRIPIPNSMGGTEVPGNAGGGIVGGRAASAYFQMLTEQSSRSFVTRNQVGDSAIILGPGNTPAYNPADGIWKILVITWDVTTGAWVFRSDGVTKTTYSTSTNIATGAGAKQIVLGAYGAASAGRFVGDMGGIFHVKDRALTAGSDDLTKIEAYLTARKATMS